LDDIIGCIIKAVFLQRPAPQTVDHNGFIGADEVKDCLDIHVMIEEMCLFDIARDAIKDKDVTRWPVAVCADHSIHGDAPEFDSCVIGHEEATARVFNKNLTKVSGHVQVSENFSTRKVHESGNGTKGFSKCAFATAGGSKE
jgi:hypothetical protein